MTDAPNPFEIADDGEKDEDDGKQDTATMAELRKFANRRDRDAKQFEKELTELRTFREERVAQDRESAINKAFTEVGLKPTHAKLFKAVNPTVEVEAITTEAVAAFAAEYELATGDGVIPDAPEQKPEGFSPVVVGSGAPLGILEGEAALKMAREDPAAFEKLFQAGRVKLETL